MSKSVSIKQDELAAMMILEELYKQPFHKSERPDLYSDDFNIGVEVTRAYDIEYEKDNGELRYSQLNDISGQYAHLYDLSLQEVIDRIAERLVDKMIKLANYKRYPHDYLYMRTSLKVSDYPIKLLSDEFDKMKQFAFNKCEAANAALYGAYEIIIIECTDAILTWNWKTDDLTIKSDVFGVYSDEIYDICEKANYLISEEADGRIAFAGEHTTRKQIGW
ncbi:hypothetical protein J6A31_04960 [bacterium]|nr:hypothetical protein [bacterium]